MAVRPSIAELPKTLINSISAFGNGALVLSMGVNPVAAIGVVLLGLGISTKEFFDQIREKTGKNDEGITEEDIFDYLGEISSDVEFLKKQTLVDQAAFSIAVENLSDVNALPSADLDGDRPEKHHRMFFEWIEREFRASSDRDDFNQRVQRQIGENLVFKITKLEEKQRALFEAQNEALASEWKSLSETLNRIETTGEDTNARVRNIEKNLTPAPVILHGAAASIRLPVSDFAGRAADIDALESLAASGAIVSGVRGTGGIGKTELAREIARRWNGKFAENYEIDCLGAGDDPFTSVQIIERLLRIWHPTAQLPEDVNTLASALHGELGKRKGGVLLLLDNVSDAAQIAPLFPLPAGCAALVTSRRRFAMAGMKTHDLEAMDEAAAIALLQAIASGKLENEETIARDIAIACGRLPKALRLAGEAITNSIPPATWLTRFQANRLAHLSEVESALEISLELLDSDADRRAFYRLGIFTASFPRDAAHVVLAEADAETADTRLENLHAISLIDYRPETDRFVLHDLAREYALKTGGEAESMAASATMAQWALAELTAAQQQFLKGNEHILPALAWFDQERRHIEAAHAWAAAHWENDNLPESEIATHVAAHLPTAGVYLLQLRQHSREQVAWLELQVKATRKLGRKDIEGAALGNLGLAWARIGEVRKAIKFYEQYLEIAREIGDRRGEGNALGNLGIAWKNLGEVRKAIEFYEQRIEIAREIGDRRGEGNVLGNLGNAWYSLGEVRKAIEFYEQQIGITREIGDRRGEGSALGNLGNAWYSLGEVRKAIEFYEQQIGITREIGDRRGEGNVLWNSALAYDNLGERAEAIRRAAASLVIREAIEDPSTPKVRAKLEGWRGE